MTNHLQKYTVNFKIRSYEVDDRQQASISSICNYFQEAAGLHARELKFDITDLQKKGLTWVLYKMQTKILKFPKRWDSVFVETWPSVGNGIRAYRDYQLFSNDGELLAAGLSQWMILDIQRRKPVKIPQELNRKQFKTDTHVLGLHTENLARVNRSDAEFITTVGLNDLDMNSHANNVKYVDWLTGYRFAEGFKDVKCTEFVIQFSREAKRGDKIYLSANPGDSPDNQEIRTLYKNDDKTEIANAIIQWS